ARGGYEVKHREDVVCRHEKRCSEREGLLFDIWVDRAVHHDVAEFMCKTQTESVAWQIAIDEEQGRHTWNPLTYRIQLPGSEVDFHDDAAGIFDGLGDIGYRPARQHPCGTNSLGDGFRA